MITSNKDNSFAISKIKAMTTAQIKQFIQGGEWVSIAPELRTSINKTATGTNGTILLHKDF